MFVSTKLSIGQKVFFFTNDECLQRGTVTAIHIEGIGEEQEIHYDLKGPNGIWQKPEAEVFTSADSAFWSLEP